MFTANSMNCLTEAIGLALPGNGTVVATHRNRTRLLDEAARLIVKNAYAYYKAGDSRVLPCSIATREAFLNAMTLDIAMGGSTNTVLHLLAVAHEAEVPFGMDDIDALSRRTPCLCKVAPNTQQYHIQDVNRAGGVLGILGELARGGLLDTAAYRVDGLTLAEALARYDLYNIRNTEHAGHGDDLAGVFSPLPPTASTWRWARRSRITTPWTPTAHTAASATWHMPTRRTAGWPCFAATSRRTVAW